MKRNQLIDLLQRYSPEDLAELNQVRDTLHFVRQNEQCFERTLSFGHITGSAWLLNKDGTKALLTHHAKLDKWFQLGGHCDGNPDVLTVALQEAREESGIQHIEPISSEIFDVDIHLIPERGKEQAHYHYDIRFLLRVTSDEAFSPNHETKELRWIDMNPSKSPTSSPSILRMIEKWNAQQKIICC